MFRAAVVVLIYFVSILSSPATSNAQETQTTEISNEEVIARLIDLAYFSNSSLDVYLAQLSFEEVYRTLSIDSLIQVLIDEGLLLSSLTAPSQVYAALINKGYDIDTLQVRNDGLLHLLGNQLGGSLLAIPVSNRRCIELTREQVRAAYERNHRSFVTKYYSRRALLELLGSKPLSDLSPQRPIRGLLKFAGNVDLIGLNYLTRAFNLADLMPLTINSEADVIASMQSPSNIARAISKLNGSPAGAKHIYVGGGVLYDIYNNSGQQIPHNDAIVTPSGPLINPATNQAFRGPWMDTWAQTVQARLSAFIQAFVAAGGTFDYVMIDYEDKKASLFEMNGQCAGQPNCVLWTGIQQDSRWPALRSELEISNADVTNNIKNGVWGGSSSNPTINGQKWNLVQERHRNRNFQRAIYNPILSRLPHVKFGSFEDGFRSDIHHVGNAFRFTSTYNGLGGLDDAELSGVLPSEGLRAINTTYDGLDGTKISRPDTAFANLIGLNKVLRANAAVSKLKSLHWLSGPDYYSVDVDNVADVLPFYPELVFHTALMGAEQLFFQTSSWSTREGHIWSNDIVAELNDANLLGGGARETITLESISYNDTLILSGSRVGSRLVYRISWASGTLADNLTNEGNGSELVFRNGQSELRVSGARVYHPATENSSSGAWLIVDDPSSGKLLHASTTELDSTVLGHNIPRAVMALAESNSLGANTNYELEINPVIDGGGERRFLARLKSKSSTTAGALNEFRYLINSSLQVESVFADYSGLPQANDHLTTILRGLQAVGLGQPYGLTTRLIIKKIDRKGKIAFLLDGRKGTMSMDKRGRLKIKIKKRR